MTKSIDILAFSPHPDDAELGCAGSLILALGQGLRTAVADLSEGEHASKGTLTQKREEKKKAARIMGLCHRFSLRLPDTAINPIVVKSLFLFSIFSAPLLMAHERFKSETTAKSENT